MKKIYLTLLLAFMSCQVGGLPLGTALIMKPSYLESQLGLMDPLVANHILRDCRDHIYVIEDKINDLYIISPTGCFTFPPMRERKILTIFDIK